MKAEDLVTQVQRGGAPHPAKQVHFSNGASTAQDDSKKKGFFGSFCRCFANEDDGTATTVPARQTTQTPAEPEVVDRGGYYKAMLGPLAPEDTGKKTIVLDLDETLVHSSFRPIPDPDFVIPVEIEGVVHNVYVAKRPFVDKFLEVTGQLFEVVVFTASLSKYADPLLDALDTHNVIRGRLFREACVHYGGNYVKDLSKMGRALKHTIIVDNSPHSYAFQPMNAIPVESWFDDMNDTELLDLIPLLEQLSKANDIIEYLAKSEYIQSKLRQLQMLN